VAHWILQFNPAKWRIRDFFDDGRDSGVWTVRRYLHDISAGDDFAIWFSGRRSGVAALGKVTRGASFGSVAAEDERYWTEGHEREQHRWTIPVRFTQHFLDDPIPRSELTSDDRFKHSLIIRCAGGANPFPVEPSAWKAITDRV
jgi:predicted RNA-binding protein with PUA-like domain